jgi:hypothetical protein
MNNNDNPILSQVLRQKAIQWKDGRVFLWGLTGMFSAMFSLVYLQRCMEEELGREQAMKIFYWQGKFQSIQGISINDKKHGFAKKLPEKIKGDPFCEYVVKPKENWDENDPLFKEQTIPQYIQLKDIVSNKQEPYLAYEAKGK